MKNVRGIALLAALLFTPALVAATDNEEEIKALAERPHVRAALEHLVEMEDELLADLVELTEIPAPPFGEGPRGERLAEMLVEAGLTDVTIGEAGNVIGQRPGRDGRRVVALTAHIDTVFPIETDVTVHVEGDTYTAPGVGDNTRGVGSHRYRVTFRGPGGHSWGAFGTANPHHALGRAIDKFTRAAPEVTADGEKTSFNVGRIGGGTSINSVPFESWMEVDLRSGSQDKLDTIDALLQAAVEDALREENASRTRGEPLTVEMERVGKRPAAKGNRESILVQRAAAAIAWAGLEPDYRISSTDANHPISVGVPAITLSRGGISRGAHAPAESWENKDSHIALHVALLTLLAEAGVAG